MLGIECRQFVHPWVDANGKWWFVVAFRDGQSYSAPSAGKQSVRGTLAECAVKGNRYTRYYWAWRRAQREYAQVVRIVNGCALLDAEGQAEVAAEIERRVAAQA